MLQNQFSPKGLYLTRPSIMHYTTTREELDEAANKVFEMFISGKVKTKISKNILLKILLKLIKDLEEF